MAGQFLRIERGQGGEPMAGAPIGSALRQVKRVFGNGTVAGRVDELLAEGFGSD